MTSSAALDGSEEDPESFMERRDDPEPAGAVRTRSLMRRHNKTDKNFIFADLRLCFPIAVAGRGSLSCGEDRPLCTFLQIWRVLLAACGWLQQSQHLVLSKATNEPFRDNKKAVDQWGTSHHLYVPEVGDHVRWPGILLAAMTMCAADT